uniref:Uncharacterized protein n=2 Tax=Meloidogyne TaxID=189290 RepID=A0A915NHF6_9BILA
MKLFTILLAIVIQWMFKIVVGFDFKVHVLPTEYSWKVSVTSEGFHVTNPEQVQSFIGQSSYIEFELEEIKQRKEKRNISTTIEVYIESVDEIEGKIRSQTWTLYPNPGSSGTDNFYDFSKVHLFNFGQYKPVGNSLYLDIQV